MPREFEDSQGRRWGLVVSVVTAKRVRELTGHDVFDFEAWGADSIRFVDILYAMVKPQADQLGVTDEQFGEAMVGPALVAAGEQLFHALADFREGHPQAIAIRKAIEATQVADRQMADRLERLDIHELANAEALRVCRMVDDVEQDLARRNLVQQMVASGAPSTDAPASAE
jgi:hypothetical protein